MTASRDLKPSELNKSMWTPGQAIAVIGANDMGDPVGDIVNDFAVHAAIATASVAATSAATRNRVGHRGQFRFAPAADRVGPEIDHAVGQPIAPVRTLCHASLGGGALLGRKFQHGAVVNGGLAAPHPVLFLPGAQFRFLIRNTEAYSRPMAFSCSLAAA